MTEADKAVIIADDLARQMTSLIRNNPPKEKLEVLVILNIDGECYRLSSGLDDTLRMVSALELAKFDVLRRM